MYLFPATVSDTVIHVEQKCVNMSVCVATVWTCVCVCVADGLGSQQPVAVSQSI